jgi:epsilon-lactone hydrolase
MAKNSLRSRLLIFLMRHRHWLRLRRRQAPITSSVVIPAMRKRVERSLWIGRGAAAQLAVSPVDIDGLHGEWIGTASKPDGRVVLYFHGGGYVMGSCQSHRAVAARFAVGSAISVLVFEYRLAPEHPFPAALDDALKAYRWLLAQHYRPSNITFLGDSAGGGLCLATMVALRERGIALPAAAAVLSPWTDLACTGQSYAHPDPLAPPGAWGVFAKCYAGQADPATPLISPLYADLSNLPPMLIYVGERESMRDDSTRFAWKAREAGVDVRLEIGAGMIHCYPAFAPLFPEATAAMHDICTFLKQHTPPDLA